MIIDEDPRSPKDILLSFGYSIERVVDNDHFKGVAIHRNGKRVHKRRLASYDFALRLCKKIDYKFSCNPPNN